MHQIDGVRILLLSTVPPRKERHNSEQKRGEDSRDSSRLALSGSGRITKHTDDSPAAHETSLNTLTNLSESHHPSTGTPSRYLQVSVRSFSVKIDALGLASSRCYHWSSSVVPENQDPETWSMQHRLESTI